MKKIILLVSVFTVLVSCKTKVSETLKTEEYTVTTQEIKDIVSYLASDDLKGRDVGSQGIADAATFVETKLKSYGVKPYFETYRDDFKVGDLDAFNVVGYLEGTDADLKDEFIVIGAHYDHIGQITTVENDSIANGANDNAAGTSGVLAMAKYFGAKKSNKRSLLFVTFSAEEKGLIGSKHLAQRLKEADLNLYTMINLEMIGVSFKDRDYQAFITGYDKSNLAEVMNTYAGEKFVGFSDVAAKYSLFKRSDNFAFYEAFNVPSHTVSSCDLTNFDFYHHVNDEVDQLDYPFMTSLINTLAPVIEKMANAETQEIKLN
ncbi:M28 family peptidase [Olleya sp. HaHaR_3_96]|uniref:M28 family peptidase n=1 Tax=Olleya sp. HaHaR_3_96 TaxID=2745560 RepID=UPI001C4E989D|nr:M28 family peptidase [Olleya sp. HaHaR_3_96]QXP60057.1 M28 family peptidase [Olleya sp. HaHaR_3_96]